MDGVFAGADRVAVVVPPDDPADPDVGDLSELLRQESYEFEVELGAPVEVTTAVPAGVPRLTLAIDPDTVTPTLTLDQETHELVATGADLAGVVDAVNLIRTLRTRGLASVVAGPVDELGRALDVVEHEVDTTYLLRWAWTRHHLYRERYAAAMAAPRWSHLEFVRLTSATDVDRWLATL